MKFSVAAAVLGLGSSAYAQVSQKCQANNVCFSLNIPDATVTSGSGDIYFQIKAPSTNAWVALGQGTSMTGAQMFLVYANAAGTNVTLSPRTSTGHSQPQYSAAIKATLLPGSGVIDGNLVANVKCSSCTSFTGADFKTGAGSWIYGVKAGAALKSDSTSAAISIHSGKGAVAFDFAAAKGGSSANPFDAPKIRGRSPL